MSGSYRSRGCEGIAGSIAFTDKMLDEMLTDQQDEMPDDELLDVEMLPVDEMLTVWQDELLDELLNELLDDKILEEILDEILTDRQDEMLDDEIMALPLAPCAQGCPQRLLEPKLQDDNRFL